jgi:hypothetical protein
LNGIEFSGFYDKVLVKHAWLCKVEITIEKFKSYKSPGIDQIPAELIQAGRETLYSEIHKVINSAWNKEELPQQWKKSAVVHIYR